MQTVRAGRYRIDVALRVLSRWNQKLLPDRGDVDLLKQYLPDGAGLSIDELACKVIQHEIELERQKLAPHPDSLQPDPSHNGPR